MKRKTKKIVKIILLILIILLIFLIIRRFSKLSLFAPATESVTQEEPLIYYGEEAKSNEIPWQVALFIKDSLPSKTSFCGGVILNDEWIVTAAHCFEFMENDTLQVRDEKKIQIFSGSINLENVGVVSNIEKVIIPSDYRPTHLINDIALIKLSERLDLSLSIQNKIDMPSYDDYVDYVKSGNKAIISGWGRTETEERPIKLMKAEVPLADSDTCFKNYYSENELITEDMLCAGMDSGGIDACQGDSGGPLYIKTTDNRNILIGIISWGKGCALTGLYGVYTNFFNYIDWVEDECSNCTQPILL